MASSFDVLLSMISVIILLRDEDFDALNIWDLCDNLGNEISSSERAWLTANCAYLVVIVISVTRPDVLLSCEAAEGEHFSHIHPHIDGA